MNVIRFQAPVPARTPLLRAVVAGLLLVTAAAVVPPTAVAPKVTVQKPATALPGARYAWAPMPGPLAVEADPRVQDPQFRARLEAALDKALQAKGYQPVGDRAQADFLVTYRIGVRDLEQTVIPEEPEPAYPEATIVCTGGDCSQLSALVPGGAPVLNPTTEQLLEGALQVEVLEPRSFGVLWRALNRGAVKREDVRQVHLETVARETLARLPDANP